MLSTAIVIVCIAIYIRLRYVASTFQCPQCQERSTTVQKSSPLLNASKILGDGIVLLSAASGDRYIWFEKNLLCNYCHHVFVGYRPEQESDH